MKHRCLTIGLILLVLGCAKVKTPVENDAHPAEWSDPQSAEFHALTVTRTGTVGCVSCHGSNLSASTSFCITCHQKQTQPISYPHPSDWIDFKSTNNHGAFVEQNEGKLTCNNCHEGQNDRATPCANCHVGTK